MSKRNLSELHWKDEYNGRMIQRNKETGELYILPWNYEIKLNLETGEYINTHDKEAWSNSEWSTINQLKDRVEIYDPTLIGEISNRKSPEYLHRVALNKWGVDIPEEYFARVMDGWISNRSAGKQYVHVGEEYVLFAPASCNNPRVSIHKYFPNCEWMQMEGEV